MNKELIALKSQLILALEAAKLAGVNRTILELASKAAALEGRIARDFIVQDRADDALVNLISQAACFGDAKRLIEKERVLRFAAELAVGKKAANWINNEIRAMGTAHPNPATVFGIQDIDIEGNENLRRPQKGAYQAARDFFASPKNEKHVIVQLPVGCGKTGVMAILPFGISRGRVLVVAPNLIIRDNLQKSLDSYRESSFLRERKVLKAGRGPTCAVLDEQANIRDCDEASIVVSNIQQLVSGSRSKWLDKLSPDFFDLILMDEGHHNVASTWQQALGHFPDAKIASFTATPFRADGQKVEGTRIYHFPIEDAIREGYVKDIASHRIEPEEITFTYRGETQTHSLEEITRLKEKDWFSKGVALSPECNKGIVDHSITCMRQLRDEGSAKHAIVAAACSIDHANAIRAMYEGRGVNAEVIHSDLPLEKRQEILTRLEGEDIDVIVQVQLLGEGADYPNLSVAAIFRPFRHVVPYVQFVGRIMRVIKQNSPANLDNRGYVVSHVGLNVDRWWKELRDIDEGDQEFLEELASSDRAFLLAPSAGDTTPTPRRRFMPEMVVLEETIAHYVKDRFLAEDVSALAEDIIAAMQLRGLDLEALGLSREELESKIVASANASPARGMVVEQPVQPQKERQLARKRLQERVKSAAKELLNELKLPVVGFDLPKKFPHARAQNNLAAAIVLLNLQVQAFLSLGPNERDIATTDQLKRAHDAMDEIIDAVAQKFRTK